VDRPPGTVTYTQLLNAKGGIECDLTATRLEADRYLLVTGTAFGAHDLGWLRRNRGEADVTIRDVTASLACFGLWGPAARDILQPLTADDVSNAAFPFLSARRIVVGDAPCLALRVTYVGELGWELYPESGFAVSLWDTLHAAGTPHGAVPAGYRAIDSLRIEEGYRAWGLDITPEDGPREAGLGFAIRPGEGFIGDEALRGGGEPARRLACIVLGDPRLMVLGNEPVFAAGAVAGRVTSGGIGYAVEASIGFAYLPSELCAPGTPLEVRVFDRLVPAEVRPAPLWDPRGERLRS
jgi:4-methylaminobutanoate oxidase (formaldehyde-forming)